MYKNQIWLAFLSTIGLIVFWYTALTGIALWNYFSIQETTKPNRIDWSVKANSRGKFVLAASYQFRVKNRFFDGETVLNSLPYRSFAAAQKALNRQKTKSWTIWYAPENPQNSKIERTFPLKTCIYTFVLWSVFVNFIRLGFRTGGNKAFFRS